MNYYNEIDPYAAEWLRNLIKAGHIAPGFVDERSIEDVTPSELMEYTQCHFFAGIGVWSHALRSAGWPDSRPVWTGSCPCQPFSSAGKGDGFADERHLWPAFNHLIAECRPSIVIGEQVAAKAVEPWIDLVHADLEALGYTFGAIPFPSAGIGAPHIRDRMYWVADATSDRWRRQGAGGAAEEGRQPRSERTGQLSDGLEGHGSAIGMADSAVRGRQQLTNAKPTSLFDSKTFANEQVQQPCSDGASPSGLADSDCDGQTSKRRNIGEMLGVSQQQRADISSAISGRSGIIGGLDNNNNQGLEGHRGGHQAESGRDAEVRSVAETSESGGLADTDNPKRETRRLVSSGGNPVDQRNSGPSCDMLSGGLADTECAGVRPRGQGCAADEAAEVQGLDGQRQWVRPDAGAGHDGLATGQPTAGPTNGFWGAADWLLCRDGKWRPVEPGTFPLAHGATSRVGRLRAYGNAINAKAAQAFIECVI